VEGDTMFLTCNKEGCCGLQMTPGIVLERKEMEEHINFKILEKSIEQQKNTFFFNYMPQSLDKLEKYLSGVTEKNKLWKIRNNVQAI
jgi:hypothetical protein